MTKKKAQEVKELHQHSHASYIRILNALKIDYLAKENPKYMVVPYLLMCAATLEARLNDELIDYTYKTWKENSKYLEEGLLSMNFRGKLNLIVPILTNNQYQINRNHQIYHRLSSLISIRNSLVHPKTIVHKYIPLENTENKPFLFPSQTIPPELFDALSDPSMGYTKNLDPTEYHDAIEKFEKYFLRRYPDRLCKIAMVIKHPIN